ncbi:NAD-dependent epimerase/dehydratase family protein [Candidatus Poribacteria bacterium]|nr:NAD-dependent epimerase/dehydratase family protein [Candidatus Poribacteria bacterium]
MKILVTGGAGFIGSHLVDRLIQFGHEVVVVDNLATGYLQNLNPCAKFYEASLLDPELSEIFQQEKPDIVSHHAAQNNVRRSNADPIFDAQHNILGSIRLIQACIEHSVKKVIYASSGGTVYGEPTYLPVDEAHPIAPISPYGISKHTVEHYLFLAAASAGLNYTVLRYANIYGPRQHPQGGAGVIAIFAEAMLKGVSPRIFGDGSSTRDYLFISDAVEVNLLALTDGDREIYHVSSGEQVSLKELFCNLKGIIGSVTEHKGICGMSPVYAEPRLGEIHRIALSPEKIQRDMGWTPQISLQDGLEQTVPYCRSLPAILPKFVKENS